VGATKEIPAHVQRMQEEREQLADRLTKLKAFIDGDKFAALEATDQGMMVRQSHHMGFYLETLDARIERANGTK